MTVEVALATLLAGGLGSVLLELFRKYAVKLGGIWAAVAALVVSYGLAAAAIAVTGEPVVWTKVVVVAVLVHEALKKLLPSLAATDAA